MSAVQQLHEEKKLEALEEADFAYQEQKQLIKEADNLYVPADFEKNHAYFADEAGTRAYMGITSVLNIIAKPALIQWAANMAVDYIKSKTKNVVVDGMESNIRGYITDEMLEEARFAHRKTKEKAGADGTDIHAEIEKLIKVSMEVNNGKIEAFMLNDELPKQVKEFAQWAMVNSVIFLASEKRLCSQSLWIAGTADFFAIVNGKLMVGDIKTNKSGIQTTHFIQASAYAHMAKEMGLYEEFGGVVIVNVPKHGGIKVQENYDLSGNFEAFKAALVLHKFLNN